MDVQPQYGMNTQPLLDIPAILAILWQRKMVILMSIFVFIILAMGYLSTSTPTFKATGVILLDPRESNTTNSINVLSGIGTDSAAIASQVAVISSTALMRKVFDSENIAADGEYTQQGLISRVMGAVRGRTRTIDENAIFEAFRSKVGVEREGLTYVMNISFTSTDPQKAARVVNAIIDQYISGQIAEKSGASSEATGLLNESIEGLREAVNVAEQAVEAYKIDNNIFDVGAGRTLLDSQVEQLNNQWVQAQEAAREAGNLFTQASAIGSSADGLSRLTEILPSTTATSLRDTYNLRLAAQANAQAIYGARHPSLVGLQAELDSLRVAMGKEAQRIVAELKASKQLADQNVDRIADEITTLRSQSGVSSQKAVALRQLERNADAARKVLEQSLDRSQETSQLEQLQRPDVRIVSKASTPLKASWPRPSLLLGVAGFFGLLVGCALAMLLGPVREKKGAGQGFIANLLQKLAQKSAPANNVQAPLQTAQAPTPISPVQVVRPDVSAQPVTSSSPIVQAMNHQPAAFAPAPPTQPHAVAIQLVDHGVLETRFSKTEADWLPAAQRAEAYLELVRYPQSPFAQQVSGFLSHLMADIPFGKKPSVFLVSSISEQSDKAAVATALALQMQKQGVQPLLIDLASDLPQGTIKLDTFLAQNGQVDLQALIDRTTGIATLSPSKPEHMSMNMPSPEVLAENVIARFGALYDAVVVIGAGCADINIMTGANTMMTDLADKQIVVLTASEHAAITRSNLTGMTRKKSLTFDLVTLVHADRAISPIAETAFSQEPAPTQYVPRTRPKAHFG